MAASHIPGTIRFRHHTALAHISPIDVVAALILLVTSFTACGSGVDGTPPAAAPTTPTPGQEPPSSPPVEFSWTVTSPEPDPATFSWPKRYLADGMRSTLNNQPALQYPANFWEQDLDFGHFPRVEIEVRALREESRIPVQVAIDVSGIPVGWNVSHGPVVPNNLHKQDPIVYTDQAIVFVGGYGTIVASAETDYGSSSLRIVMPGRNRDPVELVTSPLDRFVIPGPPELHPLHDRCDPEIRSEALLTTGFLWEHWTLPIPVDVIDNFPDDFSFSSGSSGDEWYRSPVNPYSVIQQIEDYAQQIEDAMGFRIITPGIVSKESADFSADRPRRTQRFHIGYGLLRCPFDWGIAACADYRNGIASWNIRAITNMGRLDYLKANDTGDIVAVAHELEHLLGFKHPPTDHFGDPDRYSDGPGVPMVYPRQIPLLPGQNYWSGRRIKSHIGTYRLWDESRYTAPETLQNLYCIFRDHPRQPRRHDLPSRSLGPRGGSTTRLKDYQPE